MPIVKSVDDGIGAYDGAATSPVSKASEERLLSERPLSLDGGRVKMVCERFPKVSPNVVGSGCDELSPIAPLLGIMHMRTEEITQVTPRNPTSSETKRLGDQRD